MFPWLDFLGIILIRIIEVLFEPLFWMVLALVFFQYRRLQQDQLRMFGVYGYNLWRQTATAAAFGVIGGVIGSMVLGLVGVTLNQLGLSYIWPLAVALMFINMRFMCFAYAGGLVALSSILLGWPQVNVPQVLALVAGLHVTESILIYIGGRYSAVPLILRRDDGRLVGAFSLQNFWPLPLVLLFAQGITESAMPAGVIHTPDWWPLLPMGQTLATGETWLYHMLPVVAALGYADIAVTSTPAQRRRLSALHLALYSLVLLGLALLSVKYPWLQIVAAIASPVGHELLIQLDNRQELRGTPRFVPPPQGVMVLDTVFGTPARRMGFRPGDILLTLGGLAVNSGFELARAISFAPPEFDVELSREGRVIRLPGRFLDGERRLGIILVPEGYESHSVQLAGNRYGLYDWLKRRFGR